MNVSDVVEPRLNASTTTGVWNGGNETVAEDGGGGGGGRVNPWSTWRLPWYGVTLLAVAYVTVAVVGVLNNGLVIATVFYHASMRTTTDYFRRAAGGGVSPCRSMRTVTNYFLANLAVADILVCVFVLPATLLQNILTGNNNNNNTTTTTTTTTCRPTTITTLRLKNDTDVAHYNFNAHQPILVIFGINAARGVCYRMFAD